MRDERRHAMQAQPDRAEMTEDFVAAAEDVPAIRAPLLIHYAELDERINAGWPAFQEALDAHGTTCTMHMYEGVTHGFHNDTTPRYDEAAARLAQERTIAFFNEHPR